MKLNVKLFYKKDGLQNKNHWKWITEKKTWWISSLLLNQILKIFCCRPPTFIGRFSSMDLPNFPANQGPGPCRKISQRRGSAAVRAESMSRASRHRDDFSEPKDSKKSSQTRGVKFPHPRSFWFLGGFFLGGKHKKNPTQLGRIQVHHLRSSWTPQESTLVTWKSGNEFITSAVPDSKPPNSSRSCRLVHQIHLVPPRPWSRSSSGPCWHWHELEAMEFVRGSVALHGWPKTLSWFEDRDGENSCQMSNAPELQWMKMVAS